MTLVYILYAHTRSLKAGKIGFNNTNLREYMHAEIVEIQGIKNKTVSFVIKN